MRQTLIKEWTATGLLLCGIILAFVSLLIPPPGEIHESVLYIFAQILIYAGSIFGIDAYIRKSLSPPLPAPGAFANAAREGAEKNVTNDAFCHKHQREHEPLQDPEHRRENEQFHGTQHRRNLNDRGDPKEED